MYTEKKIKICHFADHITGKADGIFTHILQIVKYSDRSRFEHHLCFQGGEMIESRFADCEGKLHSFPSFQKKIPIKGIISFIKLCSREHFEIIHTHFLKPYVIAAILKPFFNYKVIYNYNGLFIKNEFNTTFQQFIYRFLHTIICKFGLVKLAIAPSFESREKVLSETKKFPSVEVYYNCCEITECESTFEEKSQFRFQELKKEKYLVGIIARLYEQKRIDIALQILSKVKNKMHFVILGDGIFLNKLKDYASRLNVLEKVTFAGYYPEIKKLLFGFDVILITSDYEGLPLTLFEAMAAGIPIVSTDVGGIPEIIQKEKCGLLFPKGDAEKGAQILDELLNDEKRRIELGNNGRNAIKNNYNPITFGNRFNAIYSEVLND